MVNPIPEFVKNIWSKWDIRGVVLTSLFLQITLIFLTPFRKRTRNAVVLVLVWFTYLFADYTANFGVGLISNKYGDEEDDSDANGLLIAFWAPFLLMHLGTIKFSERTRSLQLASISNFQERSMSSYQDTKTIEESIKELEKKFPLKKDDGQIDTSSNQTWQKKEQLDDVDVVSRAFFLFNKFKGLTVDTSINYPTIVPVSEYFEELTAMDALRLIEVELNFMYEAFYTKALLVHSKVGFILRFVSICCVVAALVLFIFDQKHGCNEFDVKVTYTLLYGAVALDVVSFFMLIFSDHTFASFNSLDSQKKGFIRKVADYIFKSFLKLRRPKWVGHEKILCRQIWCRRWSESISGLNFISYCLHKRNRWIEKTITCIGARGLEHWTHEEKNPVPQDLWIFIFRQLQIKYKKLQLDPIPEMVRLRSSRGMWIILEDETLQKDPEKLEVLTTVLSDQISFTDTILNWHIATNLLFYADDVAVAVDVDVEQRSGNVDHENAQQAKLHRDFSMVLSDYMLYLLLRQPTMMSAVMGIGFEEKWKRSCDFFRDYFFHHHKSINEMADDKTLPFTEKFFPFFSKDTRKKSHKQKVASNKLDDLLHQKEDYEIPETSFFDASLFSIGIAKDLVDVLNDLERTHKWKIIAQVWLELLSYAALNCSSINHVQQLGKGGEFISLLWLLSAHFCIGQQIQFLSV
ncbi:uncharacterized protein LOC113854982 isoform X2 [Abrus precatorius]|uniref:Uncharacterized protein LOC113854982 isoform X2 n=1 Tax=Abrus precatorius TaxID=3816 RepID=A0A8B8KGV0_ABRPR|nr:uncharacterized protein LOC113854982 isoform X2 [Abrus precatorius]